MENKALSSLLKFKQRYSLAVLVLTSIFLVLGFRAQQACGQDVQQKESSWFIDIGLFSASAHAPLTCEDCHGEMETNGKEHPDTEAADFLQKEATRKYDYSRCESCHIQAYKRYQKGVHATALEEEAKLSPQELRKKPLEERAPTCGNCHSVHYQPPGQERIQAGQRMVRVCGDCHPEQAASYLQDFHGRAAVDLKNDNSAYCSDCHGAHTVQALDKQEEALAACRRCHLEAENKFTGYIVHASLKSHKDEEDKDQDKLQSVYILNIIKGIVSALVVLVLVFFFGLSLLWILRELHEKLRKH